jgi:hypothetical protein
MKRYVEFLSEDLFGQFETPDRELLYSKIQPLKKWLYVSNGLGLMSIVDEIFEEYGYKNGLTDKEIEKFYSGLEILKKTDLDPTYISRRIREKIPGGIESQKLVRDPNGEWDLLNKLNTNYGALSEMVTELVMRGVEFNPSKGKPIYDRIVKDPTEGLTFLKPYMKKLIVLYFIERGQGLNDFRKFCSHIGVSTEMGEAAESRIMEYLEEKGMEVAYSGGNGDFIDMIFGCDMIVRSDKFGYKTVQVKNRFPGWQSVSYYKVDWLGIGNPIGVFDLRAQTPVGF